MEDIMRAAMATGLSDTQREALRVELERDAPLPTTWPPLLANRATRRACKHGLTKAGYCVDCGTPAIRAGGAP